jgi:hypothetical protein
VAISTRQRCHYWKMAQQEEARSSAIRALVNLAQFPDDNEAAIRSLRLLEADPSEIEAPLGGDCADRHPFCPGL